MFEKLRFQNVLCRNGNEKAAFSNSFSLKSVVEKIRFHDGLVRTVGLRNNGVKLNEEECVSFTEGLV